MMHTSLRALALAVAAILLVASCGGASTGGSKEAQPAPAATVALPAPTAAPTAAPVKITMAMSSAVPQTQKIPTVQAFEALRKVGHDVKFIWLPQTEDVVAAVIRGDADFGQLSASGVFAAATQNIAVKAIMQVGRPDYAMIAPASVASPGGLNGMRVAIHGQVSTTSFLTNLMLKEFPGVKPQILVVPGSANRIQAMAAGQVDASAIQLTDLPSLDVIAPGKFKNIYDFSQKFPNIIDTTLITRTELLAKDRALVVKVIKANIAAQRAAYTDVPGLAAAIAANVPNTTLDQAKALAKLYTDAKVWPADGGLVAAGITDTLDLMLSSGTLKTIPTSAQCCDRSALDEALR